MLAIRGPSTLAAVETFSDPPTGVQVEPSSRATYACCAVVPSSCQVTYGTPPTFATSGSLALLLVETFSDKPTETQDAPSRRLTRIWSCRPSNSLQATYGTPPTSAMLAEAASRAVSKLSEPPT